MTFQTIPDVKEFEIHSVEASADGSFEVESEVEDVSLDSISLDGSNLDRSPSVSPERATNDSHDYGLGDESTTADFVDALIEEGLLSPHQNAASAFGHRPSISEVSDDAAPALSTPSLGESIHMTPLLATMDLDHTNNNDQVDSAGIPYGRTHHAERAATAHKAVPSGPPVKQPDLPHQSDQQLLFNKNAAQPSIYSDPFEFAPISPTRQYSKQIAPMPDPFITLQTTTSVLPSSDVQRTRSEDGVPLGRTSHAERMQAARMLATQSLGLGMPRSPAVSRDLSTAMATSNLPTPAKPSTPAGKSTEEDLDSLFDVSFESVRRASVGQSVPIEKKDEVVPETPKKAMPAPQSVHLPSPVDTSADDKKEEVSHPSPPRSSTDN